MDAILHAQDTSHQLFSLAIPRVSYIAQAASEYVCTFDNQRDMEVDILETSSMRVIDSVAYGHYVLGIIPISHGGRGLLSEKSCRGGPAI